MFHIPPKLEPSKEIIYSDLKINPENELQTPQIPEDSGKDGEEVPKAPEGFLFHRIKQGDTMISVSVKYNVSQARINQFNRQACFGHRLTHLVGKLLIIPVGKESKLTPEMQKYINELDSEEKKNKGDEEDNFKEPDENGKYQLRKALLYHAKNCDDLRADYYLGEANWNVRKALELYQKDEKWEKQTKISKMLSINADEAKQLLEINGWDVDNAMKYWENQSKKKSKCIRTNFKQ